MVKAAAFVLLALASSALAGVVEKRSPGDDGGDNPPGTECETEGWPHTPPPDDHTSWTVPWWPPHHSHTEEHSHTWPKPTWSHPEHTHTWPGHTWPTYSHTKPTHTEHTNTWPTHTHTKPTHTKPPITTITTITTTFTTTTCPGKHYTNSHIGLLITPSQSQPPHSQVARQHTRRQSPRLRL